MIEVVIAKNPLEPDTWEEFQTDDVCALLASQFESFPPTAKIYNGYVCEQNDVTPVCEADIDRLQRLEGPLHVVILPEDPATAAWVIAVIVVAVVAVAVTMSLVQPSPGANQKAPSPNNDLSERTNRARPFARIPDIYGTVRSTPDLIMLPYTVYENNVEVEYAYMCIGRGYYHIIDARDDTTPIGSITGAKCTVFDPGVSPNFLGPYFPPAGSDATVEGTTYSVGGGINERVRMVRRMTSVNGQTLFAPGDSGGEIISLHSTSGMFIRPNKDSEGYFISTSGTAYDLTEMIAQMNPGDHVSFTGVFFDGDHINYDYGGVYTWDASGTNNAHRLALSDTFPPTSPWYWVGTIMGSTHGAHVNNIPADPITAATTALIDDPDITSVWVNVVANNGLYQIDNDGNVTTVDVGISIICQPADENGNATGSPQTETFTIDGDANKEGIGVTFKVVLDTPGRTLVTTYRSTVSPSNAQVVDKVQWKDLYGVAEIGNTNFGDVTTVQCVTRATAGALAVKERKLNLLVQRLLPGYISGSTFGPLAPTNNVADAIVQAALDPHIGARAVNELDIPGIYNTAAVIAGYFGETTAQEFCYTFDDDNLSYEEIILTMASAVFCIAYRQGNVMKLRFEQETIDSVLLFGHRNKIPGTEKRTFSFGSNADFDCVEFTYTNPKDDARVTIYAPTQGLNPQQIDSRGIRSYRQAYFQAWRAWNKIKYGNTVVEFEALQEASLLLRNDRILVADNTRSNPQDGEVVAINVLEYQLSQKPTFVVGHSYQIILQGIDGSVDSIPITPGSSVFNVILGRAPTVSLSTTANASVRPLYWIVPNDDVRPQSFLVTKREPATSFTEKVVAMNYDTRYYDNDDDVILGTIPADPYAA
jgi:hypothetical protein